MTGSRVPAGSETEEARLGLAGSRSAPLPSWVVPTVAGFGSFTLRLLGAALLVQLLIALAPGDAVDLLPNADQLRPVLAAEWGLDRPVSERLWLTLGRLARGELGTSLTYRPGTPVTELVVQGARHSAAVLIPGLLTGLVAALVTALWTSKRVVSGRPGGPELTGFLRSLSVVPAFLAAFLLVGGFNAAAWWGIEHGLIGRPEWFALPDTDSGLRSALAVLLVGVASAGLTEQHAALHAALRELRAAPFIEATFARGAAVWPHLLLNLLPVLLELAASRSASAIAGLLVVERMLLINGAGAMLWQACLLRDVPLAIGLTLAAALAVTTARLVADLLRLWLDPRLRSVL